MLGLLTKSKQLLSSTGIMHGFFARSLVQAPTLTIYKPLPKKRNGMSATKYLHQQLLKKFDPLGKRSQLVNPHTGVRAGDVVKVTYNDRSTVHGRVLGVKRGKDNLGTNILIRNRITKLGCEVRIPVFNPKVANIEIVDKPETYLSRSKHFYVRNTKHDVGDVEAMLKKKLEESKAKKAN